MTNKLKIQQEIDEDVNDALDLLRDLMGKNFNRL